jgi:hypothetical protein
MPADTLVGRRLATGALRSAVDAAIAGTGGVVLLAGEAGMGKTALAAEAVAYAKARGSTAVWGTCWEGGGAPGFWPWIQVVRALTAEGRGAGEAVLAELTGISAERGGGLGYESAVRFHTYDLARGSSSHPDTARRWANSPMCRGAFASNVGGSPVMPGPQGAGLRTHLRAARRRRWTDAEGVETERRAGR